MSNSSAVSKVLERLLLAHLLYKFVIIIIIIIIIIYNTLISVCP